MSMGPTPAQVATQVAMLRRQRPEARILAIHTPGSWLGGSELRVDGECLPVAFCASALQISEALTSHDPAGSPLVIITHLEDGQLSLDVRARFAGRQLCRIDPWEIVRDSFRARQLDPRLPSQGWVADALLQVMPEGGYPPVASGLLDADTVWDHLLQRHLGLPGGRPDAVRLVTWSFLGENLRRYEALPPEFRAGLRQRVADTAGAVGSALLDTLDAGYGAWLLPIGLVCEILYAAEERTQMGIAQARARLEPYIAGRTLSSEMARAWFEAAQTALSTLPDADARAWLDRAQQLLADLKATEYQALSSVLTSGLDQRLAGFAGVLNHVLNGASTLDELEASVEYVTHHQAAATQPDRLARVKMALRLARYLASQPPETPAASLSQMGVDYAEQGAYVDWARQALVASDELQDVAQAYSLLAERVRQVREQQNKRFATLLAAWSKAPSSSDHLTPIEQALSTIVAKLAEATPLLLLVMDGMNYAVFRELSDDLSRRGWVALTDRPGRALPSLVSTVPSITTTSRASLLTGTLRSGNSATEKRGFAAHAGLLAASRRGAPPCLFHKGELVEAGATGVSDAVREAIRDGNRKVVGVVLNAVDDHLAKSEQLRLVWGVHQFQYLDALLAEAQLANRAVVLTSDHGHIVEAGTSHLAGGKDERWRPADGDLAAEELIFEGPRVAPLTGAERIVVPWSETVRYSRKKQGYHGGATIQEVLVPIGVFATPDRQIDGWEALPERQPWWWQSAETPCASAPPVPTPAPARKRRCAEAPVAVQGNLFAPASVSSDAPPLADWIGDLLGSSVFQTQRRLAGRVAPNDRVVETFLQAMEAHHDHMTRHGLAQALGQPEFRLRGLLAGLQRLLNVDGYQVVAVDETVGAIELNRQLLHKQFELGSP
jgi:hypothetical protein